MHELISSIAARLERGADRMANAGELARERLLRAAAETIRCERDLTEALELEQVLLQRPAAASAARLVAFAAAEYVPGTPDVPTPEPNAPTPDTSPSAPADEPTRNVPTPEPNTPTPPTAESAFAGEVTPQQRQSVANSEDVTFDPGVQKSDLTDPDKTEPEIIRTIDQITSSAPGGLDKSINISGLNTDHRSDTVHKDGVAFDVNRVDDVHVGADQATKNFVIDVIKNIKDVTAIGSVHEVVNDPAVVKAAKDNNVTLRVDEPPKAGGGRVFHVHIEANPD